MMGRQIVPSLKARLSVQTIIKCSKYIEVILKESEFLKSIIDYRNQPGTATQSRLEEEGDSSLCAVGGGRENMLIQEETVTKSGLSRPDSPYMPVDLLTLSDLGFCRPCWAKMV